MNHLNDCVCYRTYRKLLNTLANTIRKVCPKGKPIFCTQSQVKHLVTDAEADKNKITTLLTPVMKHTGMHLGNRYKQAYKSSYDPPHNPCLAVPSCCSCLHRNHRFPCQHTVPQACLCCSPEPGAGLAAAPPPA
jgi:hypothetical protein